MNKNRNTPLLKVFQWTALILCLIPCSLFFLLLHAVLAWKKFSLWISEPQKVQLDFFNGGKMVEIKKLSTNEQLDFMKYRSPSYIKQLTFGCLEEFLKYIGEMQTVPLIEDDVLRKVILNTVFCHGLERGEKDSNIAWKLPFHLQDYHVFDGFFWDVSEIRIHTDDKVSIVDKTGEVYTAQSEDWNLAKAHAQAQLTFFAPGLAHNHVHFVFPSTMAAQVRTALPTTSVLRQLLEPHTRFTQYINYKALNVCDSSRNTGSFVDRWFKPWLSFPINNDDFIHGIQENCERFYYDNLTLSRDLEDDLPYHRFLKEYYDVVRDFITKLEPLIKDDYEEMTSSIVEFLPMLKGKRARDVITALIWNCAVVHFSDHHSYLRWFASTYGCMCMRTPLITVSNKNGLKSQRQKLLQSQSESFFEAEDIYRTRCFLRSFVRFNGNESLDLTLLKTNYKFVDKTAVSAAKDFFKNLNQLDKKMHKEDKAIIALSQIVRTVCF